MSTSASSFKRARSSGLAILVALGTAWPTAPQAASADIANQPLGSSSVSAKPNVMFILDDSGSMDSAYMPDDMRDTNAVGYRSVHCNGVAYDPTQKYDLPIKADGTRYPAMEFGNALDDGYDTSSGRVNLGSSGPNVYYTYKGSEPALNWRYGADGRLQTNTFSDECRSLVGSTTATAKFDAHTVLAGTDEAANYANWYSYYRKRYLLMRSAVGLSFASLDANYRVGFTVISDEGITGNQFLNTSDFDQTQRTTFYSKLYSAAPSSFTPLRGALSKVGRYYGNAISGQSYDPASYAVTNPITGIRTTKTFECQRNYAILSTDGYWNTRAEDFSAAYNSGFDLQGNPVGQQDGNEARPMKDGSSTVIRTVTTTGSVDQVRTDTNMATDATYSRSQYIVTAATVAQCGRTNRFNLVTNEQTGSLTSTFTRSVVEDVTTSTTITVTNTNGVITTTTSPSTVTRTTVSTTNSTPVAGQATWTTTRTNTSNCQRSRDLPNATGGVAGTTYSPSETGNQQGGTNTRTLNTLAPVTLSTTNLPGTPVTTETVTNGDSNSLADIAEYYYKTDLRPTINNNVKAIGRDTATWQHMTTYTVGLGVNGSLAFDKNYLTNDPPTGDYAALINGTKVWPTPSLLNGGNADATHVDDLWHAAVNGRGQYFSAGSAGALSSAITATLADVKASIGTASAAASSTLTPSASDDWLFMSRYNSSPTWNGELFAFKFTFDANGELIQPDTVNGTPVFKVQKQLDDLPLANRTIFFRTASGKQPFNYDNLSSTQKAYFDARCTTNVPNLSQCAAISADTTNGTARLANATGRNLVDFIRGDTTKQLNAPAASDKVWRSRTNRLGDIAHASPVYVGKPTFRYADAGYAEFAAAKANRARVVYVGANDGMLHAFLVDAAGSGSTRSQGSELWAFVPTPVVPNLWRLADSDYDNSHRYYVNATPNVGDVYNPATGQWRTILVGGLGAGGRGYYALDITDPLAPDVLWEYTADDNANLGLTYGNPVITKNKAGLWTVVITSGYNNTGPGDGKGYLIQLNANTGAVVQTISTTSGDGTTPSNLGRLNAWVPQDTDNTAELFYAGDMLGNLWRFDSDDVVAPTGAGALLLGQATTPSGGAQPITARPLLSELTLPTGEKVPLVTFGTGRYLGETDMPDSTMQSVYVIKDARRTTGLGELRSTPANLVQRTLGTDRKFTSTPDITWSEKNGWFFDLDQSTRERVYLDATPLVPGIISVASVIPDGDPCTAGGTSWIYDLKLVGGSVLQATQYKVPIVGLGRVITKSGARGLVTTQDGLADPPPTQPLVADPPASVRRTSWRELSD